VQNVKISIVMPTWNRHDTVHVALNSVLAQSYANWELWVVDDGSDAPYDEYIGNLLLDGGVRFEEGGFVCSRKEKIRTFRIDAGRVIYLKRIVRVPHTVDPSLVRNSVIPQITGELVCFRDDDGYWPPHWLAVMAAPFADSEVVMAYGNRNIIDLPRLSYFNKEYADRMGVFYNPNHTGKGHFGAGADTGDVMLRMEPFKAVGGFVTTEITGGAEDGHLWRAIMEAFPNGKVVYVPEAVNYYIWHQSEIPNRTTPKINQN